MCPKRTFRSDSLNWAQKYFIYFWQINCRLFCLFCFVLFVATFSYFGLLFLIEALIELKKMLLRKKLFDSQLGNYSTPIYIGHSYSADLLDLQRCNCIDLTSWTSKLKVRFKQTFFFKMMYKECLISWFWSHTLSIILGGFIALQTSGLFKNFF